jgi:predicted membrane channel-forming protein YqfA (hemolysin III family)
MPRRLRTLVGTITILVFVCVYALFAIALADSRIVNAPPFVQTIVYILLGTIWILPLMPLIRWMEGGRRS